MLRKTIEYVRFMRDYGPLAELLKKLEKDEKQKLTAHEKLMSAKGLRGIMNRWRFFEKSREELRAAEERRSYVWNIVRTYDDVERSVKFGSGDLAVDLLSKMENDFSPKPHLFGDRCQSDICFSVIMARASFLASAICRQRELQTH